MTGMELGKVERGISSGGRGVGMQGVVFLIEGRYC